MENNHNVRNIALTVLCRVLEDKVPSHIAFSEELDKYPYMSKEDRSFAKQLIMGTVERVITLDNVIDRYSKVKTQKQKPVIRNLIRMSVYQILFMNVPDSAACNEAVKLARKRKFEGLTGFVNGILRKTVSEKNNIISENLTDTDETAGLSVKYSLPRWITDYFLEAFGPERALTAFEYFLKEAKVQIRCNISRTTPENLASELEAEGITVELNKHDERCLTISGFDRIDRIAAFKNGLFCVQDLSSVIAGTNPSKEFLDDYIDLKMQKDRERLSCTDRKLQNDGKQYGCIAQKLQKNAEQHGKGSVDKNKDSYILNILDICAAPGGKTLNLADRLKAEGFEAHFTSCDVSEQKLGKILENVERCGFDNIECIVNDGTVFNPEFVEKYDIVIADVPCSGLGVMARKPDIKLNASLDGIARLTGLQKKILENTVRYVKKDGFIVFSTCTVGDAENEDNVRFIESFGFERLNAEQICPGEYDCDGFYYSLLKKT